MAETMDNIISGVKWGQDSGYRGVVGFIGTPTGCSDPMEFMKIAPEGFRVVSTITFVPSLKSEKLCWDRLSVEQLAEGAKQVENSCLALKQASVNVIVQSGTPFAFLSRGFHSAKELCCKLEKDSGLPVVMMGLSVINALQEMKYSSVGVACTYYNTEVAAQYSKFLEDAGIKVQAMENWVSQGIFISQEEVDRWRALVSAPRIPVELVYKAARKVADHCPTAECIVISGGGVRTMDILQVLEEDLGKPVISSTSAAFWEIFVRLGVSPVIRGRGSLLASLAR